MALLVRDGAYDQIGGLAVNPPDIEYPFEKNGDLTSIILTQGYKQTPAQWIADRVAGRYLPGVTTFAHSAYGTLYLLKQSAPSPTPTGLYAFTRTWARIPAQQTEPGSLFITKPAPESAGSHVGQLVDWTVAPYGLTADLGENVYAVGDYYFAGSSYYTTRSFSPTLTVPTGGTFTLTYKGVTTAAINYNATGATIAAGLNGLSTVTADGLTFSASTALTTANAGYIDLTITVGSTSSQVTMDASSLTAAAASSGYGWVTSTTVQRVGVMWRGTVTAHGYNTSNNLAMLVESGVSDHLYILPAALWDSVDANTIAVIGGVFVGTRVGQLTGSYSGTSGAVLTRAKRVTDFYLPGVTPGIGSMDDIPLPTYQGDPDSILQAILAGTTTINYEVGELSQWRDSPILARTLTTLNAATL